MCVYSPCRVGHGDAERVIKGGKLIRFEEFCVDVSTLIKAVNSLHFDLLHGILTGDCNHTNGATTKHTEKNKTLVCTLKVKV